MTTPRVTVPVEPTTEMLVAGARAVEDFYSCGGPYPRAKAMYRAMLSAAPAPEGGAVLAKRVSPGEAINRAVGDEVLTAKALESITTAGWVFAHKDDIATREEAPAEVDEDAIKAACIAWHRAKGSDPFNVLYNGAWCGSFPHQTGPERWTFTVPAMKEAIAAYLRVQPQAREGGVK